MRLRQELCQCEGSRKFGTNRKWNSHFCFQCRGWWYSACDDADCTYCSDRPKLVPWSDLRRVLRRHDEYGYTKAQRKQMSDEYRRATQWSASSIRAGMAQLQAMREARENAEISSQNNIQDTQ